MKKENNPGGLNIIEIRFPVSSKEAEKLLQEWVEGKVFGFSGEQPFKALEQRGGGREDSRKTTRK